MSSSNQTAKHRRKQRKAKELKDARAEIERLKELLRDAMPYIGHFPAPKGLLRRIDAVLGEG